MLQVKKCWNHLLWANVISFSCKKQMSKILKMENENSLTEKVFMTFERLEEFQWNFQERCNLW